MAEPLLEVRRLSKRFGALVVTDDVSFDLRPGECHALIGPNGAGKTTLLHQLSGLVPPDAGRVLFAGRDLTRAPVHARVRLGLARTFQITAIIPSFSTLENVALAAQARTGSSLRFFAAANADHTLNAMAMDALEATGLSSRAATPAGALAHGEKRALELAMALALAPKALLLDEPMAGVGRDEGEALLRVLEAVKQRQALLLIEHDMDAVFQLADRVSVLVYGRLIASGTPDAVRADPEVRAAYLGDAG